MYKKVFRFSQALIGLSLLLSCQDESTVPSEEVESNNTTQFTLLSSNETGINFINEIPESSGMNSMVYEYIYNGGGVAIGDIDNDGLPDIYFTSNLKNNKLYKNKGGLEFEDVTTKAGVEGTFGWTTGTTMVDINADGWLDIYICKSGKGKAKNRENELYLNNKNGTFTEVAATYGLNFNGYSTQASFFDYDKDGDLDMFLLNHNVTPINTNNPENFKNEKNELVGDRLYRNDDGKFLDVSGEAGIIGNPLGFGLGVSVGDLNQDGWPDIYVANDYIEQDYLYFNNKDGTFSEDLKASLRHVSNFSMGTDIADFNNDGLLDIMTLDMVAEDNYSIKTSMSGMNPKSFHHAVDHGFHYQYMFNTLQLNNGKQKFSDIAQLAGVSNTDWSWGPLFADFDNDGLKDLFITNGLKRDFRNNDFKNHKLKRLEQAQKDGEKMSTVMEEIVYNTPQRKTLNYFFKNNGDLTFSKVSDSWGIKNATFSNGAAYADLDNDGDLDLVVNNIDEEASILKNNASNNYVQFQFKGQPKNKFGLGARIELKTSKGIQLLENYPSRGYQSSVEPILHFGLNSLDRVEGAKITWSDGRVEEIMGLSINKRILVEYKNAKIIENQVLTSGKQLFVKANDIAQIAHRHQENVYDDFEKESLLPHKMSQFGPALAVADINQDGLEDYFIGGAKGSSAALYVQDSKGKFKPSDTNTWKQDEEFEDIDAVFFDADQDGDLDLYVVSGGNEWAENHNQYQDRLYINRSGSFKRESSRLPKMLSSGSCVRPFDFDQDGDIDLFVGSRLQPQKYPYPGESFLLENDKGKFTNVTDSKAPQLKSIGLVTDAVWTDIEGDGLTELMLVGEWMPITLFKNHKGVFKKEAGIFENTNGWWNTIKEADMDGDGDMDYVVGNLGLNYKYKASKEEPFEVYSHDFDDNGTNDIVLGYYNQGDLFPLRGRQCSSNQMPFLKKKFPTYDSFGSANLTQVYGEEKLKEALHLKAMMFASIFIENNGDETFSIIPLNNQAQLSSINAICTDDFDNDGLKDLLVAGNMYQSEVETTRNDASYGLLLKNVGESRFDPMPASESGVLIDGDVRGMKEIKIRNELGVLIARNDKEILLLIKKVGGKKED